MQDNGARNTVIRYCIKKRSLERRFNVVVDANFLSQCLCPVDHENATCCTWILDTAGGIV